MKRSTLRKQALQSEFVLELYKRKFGDDGVNPSSVAEWAMESGVYKPEPQDPLRQLRRELVRFLRTEFLTDKKGRKIRKNHPVVMTDGKKRFSVWREITLAPVNHMQTSLRQRRDGIAADCRQSKLDLDYYNQNNIFGATLQQIDFNFNPDIEEMDLPTEYPDERPED